MAALGLIAGLAAAAAQASSPAPPAGQVQGLTVVGRVPVVGDLQKGVMNFRPEFFTAVRPASAMDMVQWLPGFVFQDTRDLRGLGGAGGNVLIDGKPPTSKTDTLQNILKRIPAGQIERVDIIVGGAPGIDMRGWPVVANVILKASAKKRRVVQVQPVVQRDGSMHGNVQISTSQNTGDRVVEASLEVGRNWGFGPGFGQGPWVRRDETGAVIFASDTRITVNGPYAILTGAYEFPLGGGKLRLNGLAREFKIHLDDDDHLVPGPGLYTYDGRQDFARGELGARYERALSPKTSLEAQLLERYDRHTTDDVTVRPPTPTTFDEKNRSEERVARATLRFKPSAKLTLEGSAEGASNSVVTHSARTLDGVPQVLPSADVDVRERRGELGSTLSWKPSAAFSLDAAMKFEASTLTGRTDAALRRDLQYWKPRVVATWSPDKSTQLRARIEHEVGQIDFGNFAAFSEFVSGQIRAGNPNLRPDRAWVVEGVAERKFWTGGDATLTLRRKRLIDVVDVIPVFTATGLVPTVANIGGGHETDVVLNVTAPMKRLGLDGLIVKAVVTWSRSRVTDPVDGRPRRLSNQAGLSGELHLAYDLPVQKLNVGVDAFYRGDSAFYRPLGNEASGPWARFNLFVEYRATPDLNLRAEVDNLPGQHLRLTVDSFTGLRGRSPLIFHDDRRFSSGPFLLLRARRTFE